MQKKTIDPVCVDLKNLMVILGCGRQTAEKIGRESGAAFMIGRRRLYSVERIRAFVNGQGGNEQEIRIV